MTLAKNTGIGTEHKPSALSLSAQNKLSRQSFSVRSDARERRRNNMGFGSFNRAKKETVPGTSSALQLMCKNKKQKQYNHTKQLNSSAHLD